MLEFRKMFSFQNHFRVLFNCLSVVLFFTFTLVSAPLFADEQKTAVQSDEEAEVQAEEAGSDDSQPPVNSLPEQNNAEQNNNEQIETLEEEDAGEEPPQTAQDLQNMDSPEDSSAGNDKLQLKIKSSLSPYIYDPSNKKNPFSKPKALEFEAIETDPKNRLHPVEFESLNNLKLRAIIQGGGNIVPRALFETANRQTYTLTKNDRVGMEGAVIHRIDSDRVWVMKPFIDPNTGQKGFEPIIIEFSKERKSTGNFYYER